MNDRDELSLIERRLLKLPQTKFREIVAVLEDSRAAAGGAGPAEKLMSKMRPRLAKLRPARKLTLQRVLCRAFEELLSDEADPRGPGDRVSRRSLEPFWRLFVDRADGRRLQKMSANLRAAGDEDGRRVDRLARQLWSYAAEVLQPIARPARRGLDPAVGELSERACRDFLFIADYLEVAEVLQELKRRLGPRPLRRATDEHIEALITAFEAVNAVNREHQRLVIDLLLVWVRKPSDIVAIVDRLAAEAVGEVDENCVTLAGESLVEDAEQQLQNAVGLAAQTESRTTIVRGLHRCIHDLAGVHGVVHRSGAVGARRLEQIRDRVATLVEEHVLKNADPRILGAIPHSARSTEADVAGAFPPEISFDMAPDEARIEAAEDQAIALRLCVKYADDLGLPATFHDKVDGLGRAIEDRTRWTAARIDVATLTQQGRDHLSAHLYAAIRVLELVAGSERADNLRRHLAPRLTMGGRAEEAAASGEVA